MVKKESQFLIVNGVLFPPPRNTMEIVHSQVVDSGRNVNGAVVGQKIGRKLWKINNLEWAGLDPETWKRMKHALDDFFVPVTFTNDFNERITVTMYPGDVTSKPLFVKDMTYTQFEKCKFNLIDCGW